MERTFDFYRIYRYVDYTLLDEQTHIHTYTYSSRANTNKPYISVQAYLIIVDRQLR